MSQSRQDDPEVQKDGFRAIVEAVDLDPEILEAKTRGVEAPFFEEFFDPTASWDENFETFKSYIQTTGGIFDEAQEKLEGATGMD